MAPAAVLMSAFALVYRSVVVTVGFVVFMAAALACGKRAEARQLDAELEMQAVGMSLRPAAMEQQNTMQMQRVQQPVQHQAIGHVAANASTSHARYPPTTGVITGVLVASDVRQVERTVSP